MTAALQEAHEAYRRHDWVRAHTAFKLAQAEHALAPEDLSALADAAWWLGRTDETLAISTELYRHHLRAHQRNQAARLAMEIGFLCYLRGDVSVVPVDRACSPAGPRRPRLSGARLPEGHGGRPGNGQRRFRGRDRAGTSGPVHRRPVPDPTLGAMGSSPRESPSSSKVTSGMEWPSLTRRCFRYVRARSSRVRGNIYCQLMGVCHDLAHLPRARQWTEATQSWCNSFPECGHVRRHLSRAQGTAHADRRSVAGG